MVIYIPYTLKNLQLFNTSILHWKKIKTVKKFPDMKIVVEEFFKGMRDRSAESKKSTSTDDLSGTVADSAVEQQTVASQSSDETAGVVFAEAAEELSMEERSMVINTNMEGVETLAKPRQLNAELHEHQITGISWMVHMFQRGMSFMLGDQMGTIFHIKRQ